MHSTTLSTFLVQCLLFALAAADETVKTQSNAWKWGSGGGVIGFIVLILDVIAIRT